MPPCSGMGSVRRRPESRWRRCWELVILQAQLLRHARDLVLEGITYLHHLLSPHKEENPVDQLEALLGEGRARIMDVLSRSQRTWFQCLWKSRKRGTRGRGEGKELAALGIAMGRI